MQKIFVFVASTVLLVLWIIIARFFNFPIVSVMEVPKNSILVLNISIFLLLLICFSLLYRKLNHNKLIKSLLFILLIILASVGISYSLLAARDSTESWMVKVSLLFFYDSHWNTIIENYPWKTNSDIFIKKYHIQTLLSNLSAGNSFMEDSERQRLLNELPSMQDDKIRELFNMLETQYNLSIR